MLDHLKLEYPRFLHLVGRVVGHKGNDVPRADFAIENAKVHDGAAIGVIVRIKDQRLEWFGRIAGRRRQLLHNRLEDIFDTPAFLGRYLNGVVRIETQILFDLS